MRHRSNRWLMRHNLPVFLAVLAVLLTLPALWTGWQFDDYLQRDKLWARPGLAGLVPATTELFTFLDGDPAHTQTAIDHGALAWWTLPTARTAFWRPLSGLTHWLDYQLWPQQPALMHAHSLVWFAALIVVTALMYRRLLGQTAEAGLAATLYTLDDAHGFGVAWLANRNALCATLFGVLALLAHRRWRMARRQRDMWWTLVWLGCGLLAAEAAVATLAYLVAYALWLDNGTWRQRLLSLLPVTALVVVWRVLYRALGYGAWGTSYLDPLAEPLRYVQAMVTRGPLLMLGQWFLLPAELVPFFSPRNAGLLWLAALALLLVLVWVFGPLLRGDRLARFWATGMLLALLPSCAALPANRLLFFVGLGAMGLLARFVSVVKADGWLRYGIGRGLVLIHLLFAPLALPLTALSPALLGNVEEALHTLPHDAAVAERGLVVITAPSVFSLSAIDSIRAAAGQPAPAHTLLLASGLNGAQVERVDLSTLVVRPVGGYLLGFDSVFRASWHPLALGQHLRLAHVMVTIIEVTQDGRPAAAAFRFDTPLEDVSRQWFAWRRGVYLPFTLPRVGGTVWVEPNETF